MVGVRLRLHRVTLNTSGATEVLHQAAKFARLGRVGLSVRGLLIKILSV
jgi:hypothetical protein